MNFVDTLYVSEPGFTRPLTASTQTDCHLADKKRYLVSWSSSKQPQACYTSFHSRPRVRRPGHRCPAGMPIPSRVQSLWRMLGCVCRIFDAASFGCHGPASHAASLDFLPSCFLGRNAPRLVRGSQASCRGQTRRSCPRSLCSGWARSGRCAACKGSWLPRHWNSRFVAQMRHRREIRR